MAIEPEQLHIAGGREHDPRWGEPLVDHASLMGAIQRLAHLLGEIDCRFPRKPPPAVQE